MSDPPFVQNFEKARRCLFEEYAKWRSSALFSYLSGVICFIQLLTFRKVLEIWQMGLYSEHI